MAGRELVIIYNPKCSLQGAVLVSLCLVFSLPLSSSPTLAAVPLRFAGIHRLCSSRLQEGLYGTGAMASSPKATFSKAQLMYFSKAFPPQTHTHTMLGITKAV